jgi:hypothetical protein
MRPYRRGMELPSAQLSTDELRTIGLIVVLSANIEHMLAGVAALLEWRGKGPEDQAAVRKTIRLELLGIPSGDIIKACKARRDQLPATVDADDFDDLLQRAEQLFKVRHIVAHSYWLRAEDGSLVAQRALPVRQRGSGGSVEEDVPMTADGLNYVRYEMNVLQDDLIGCWQHLWPEGWEPLPAVRRMPGTKV